MFPAVERSFDFYSCYLSGQTSGFSDALSLPALVAAMQIDDVPREEWQDLTQRCLVIHAEVMEIARRKAKR